ncbi:MAG: Phage protein [Verrucomicrobiota bacterium]|jgi:hypothetical protein
MLHTLNNPHREEAAELIARLGAAVVERELDVHYATVRRWVQGTTPVPRAVLVALRALSGVLPAMERHKGWAGWRFARDGRLYTPEGDGYAPGDIRAGQYFRELATVAQREALSLRVELTRQLEWANHGANDAVIGPVLRDLLPLPAHLIEGAQAAQAQKPEEQGREVGKLQHRGHGPAID